MPLVPQISWLVARILGITTVMRVLKAVHARRARRSGRIRIDRFAPPAARAARWNFAKTSWNLDERAGIYKNATEFF